MERLGGEPHTPLRLFCSQHHQDSALYPTITQLERAAGFRREDTAEQRLDKLESLLRRATNDLGEALPLLAALLWAASRSATVSARRRPWLATISSIQARRSRWY